jgi:DNA-directed RNA polymerase specialized sigma24 family protein
MQMPGSPESDAMAALSAAYVRRAHPSAVEQEVIELFDQWREPLLRYLSSGSSLAFSDSEDIIQETFLALFERLRRGKSRQALPEQNRWCLYLRAEGLRYREIAEVLDISLGSVSLCLERSLARIARAAER